jgi:hypothetical protein
MASVGFSGVKNKNSYDIPWFEKKKRGIVKNTDLKVNRSRDDFCALGVVKNYFQG